jgi:hypothetical protein
VANDLTTLPSGPCITVQNASNVTIDCGGHTIVTGPDSARQAKQHAILVNGSSGTTIQNCRIQAGVGYSEPVVELDDSTSATLTGNVFANDPSSPSADPSVTISNGNWINVSSNTFFMQYVQSYTLNITALG